MAEPTSGLRRMDFVSEVMSSDKAKGKMDMRFLPDPRRYTEIQREAKHGISTNTSVK